MKKLILKLNLNVNLNKINFDGKGNKIKNLISLTII